MMRYGIRRCLRHLIVALFVTAIVAPGAEFAADKTGFPFVSPIFGDGMVLQRGKPSALWGWTVPGQAVRVALGEKTAETRGGPDGKWETSIEPPAAGGPYELTIEGRERVVLRDVLVGDVWVCSGQSNMAFALREAKGGADDAKSADLPQLRFYTVGTRSAYGPSAVPRGHWRMCSPETAAEFSAVAFYFGRKLQRELKVPIGLVVSAVGGSPAESWMSADAIAGTHEFDPQLREMARLRAARAPELGSFLMHWLAEHDVGGEGETWAKPGLDDRDWKRAELGGAFADLGVPTTPAVVWFRREIDLPDPLPAGEPRLLLGQVEKMDTAYVNGQWVGASSWVENPRSYAIRAGVLKPGRNVIAVRVFKVKPNGGFLDGADAVRLQFGTGAAATRVVLGGGWRAKLSVDARPPHPMPLDWENYPTMPTVLYHGMIAPIGALSITGAIWYQGEANFTRAAQYRKLLPALIADWRATFRDPAMPFYVVSLPAFMGRRAAPGTDGWTELREAQALTVQATPHTALVVTVDTGDANNIHPTDKRPVGERLALSALAKRYGRNVPGEGPTFRALETLDGALRLRFAHTEGGLEARGATLGEFSVAGEDRVWHWAEAKIQGDAVVVASPHVPKPLAARYAWQASPLATLYNGAGLPAVPFRTDDWPLGE